jgi:hypothetical protein
VQARQLLILAVVAECASHCHIRRCLGKLLVSLPNQTNESKDTELYPKPQVLCDLLDTSLMVNSPSSIALAALSAEAVSDRVSASDKALLDSCLEIAAAVHSSTMCIGREDNSHGKSIEGLPGPGSLPHDAMSSQQLNWTASGAPRHTAACNDLASTCPVCLGQSMDPQFQDTFEITSRFIAACESLDGCGTSKSVQYSKLHQMLQDSSFHGVQSSRQAADAKTSHQILHMCSCREVWLRFCVAFSVQPAHNASTCKQATNVAILFVPPYLDRCTPSAVGQMGCLRVDKVRTLKGPMRRLGLLLSGAGFRVAAIAVTDWMAFTSVVKPRSADKQVRQVVQDALCIALHLDLPVGDDGG